jgi:hypothetical protein
MRSFNIKGIDPVEVLEGVRLPFPRYSDEMPGDERPIVNIYRYRFYNDFGLEFSFFDKISSGHVRFLLYKKDSDLIEKFGTNAWSHRATLRHMVKICRGTSKKDKNCVETWKKSLLID